MEILQEIKNWLETSPMLEGIPIHMEHLGKRVRTGAIYSQGIHELWRKADIMGRQLRRYRLKCRLCLRAPYPGGTTGEDWLALQLWVQKNPAPVLGLEQVCRLENGNLHASQADGTAIYEATLSIDFSRPYAGN